MRPEVDEPVDAADQRTATAQERAAVLADARIRTVAADAVCRLQRRGLAVVVGPHPHNWHLETDTADRDRHPIAPDTAATGMRKGLTSYGDNGFSLFLRKAFIKGAGYTDAALDRPVIGITATASAYNPCHGNMPQLLEATASVRTRTAGAALPSHDQRLAGAFALGEKFNYEDGHARHVMQLSLELFDHLRSLHHFGEHERTLLAAAAILHDIGYVISHESHHKHALYLIQNSELTGFTDLERAIIANIARYHRKAFPRETHGAFALLGEEDRDRVWKLSGILRLADALDRSHQSRVRHVQARVRGGRVRLTLQSARRCDHELWALEKKKDLFEQAFEVTVVAEPPTAR